MKESNKEFTGNEGNNRRTRGGSPSDHNNVISPNEAIGQHFLVDVEVLDKIMDMVPAGDNVIEIGVGTGIITERLAEKSNRVIGIEVDKRFETFLKEKFHDSYHNVELVFEDALKTNLYNIIRSDQSRSWHIVSNLPFHISEPFFKKLITLPVKSAILFLGSTLSQSMGVSDPRDSRFNRHSLLAHTFFKISVIAHLEKTAFSPPPRTSSDIILFTKRNEEDFQRSRKLMILRRLFLTENSNSTVARVIKKTFADADSGGGSRQSYHKQERRKQKQAFKQITSASLDDIQGHYPLVEHELGGLNIAKIGIPIRILSKPFSRLSVPETKELMQALNNYFDDASDADKL